MSSSSEYRRAENPQLPSTSMRKPEPRSSEASFPHAFTVAAGLRLYVRIKHLIDCLTITSQHGSGASVRIIVVRAIGIIFHIRINRVQTAGDSCPVKITGVRTQDDRHFYGSRTMQDISYFLIRNTSFTECRHCRGARFVLADLH